MTKLLLTSVGLANQNILNKFLEAVDNPVSEIKIIFVTTAARSEEELRYVNQSKMELLNLGIPEGNIKTFTLNLPASFDEVKDFDVVYICGGNTFFLLHKVRETGFDKVLNEFVNSGKLYLGVSAGSILAGPNIDIASPFDENDVNIKVLEGLNFTDVVVSLHYKDVEEPIIKPFTEKFKVIPITDDQAVYINNGNIELIV